MSRKRVRKLLSAAMGLLAIGGGVSNAKGENKRSTTVKESVGRDMHDEFDDETQPGDVVDGEGAEDEDLDDYEEDDDNEVDPAVMQEVSARMNALKERASDIGSEFMSLTNAWNSRVSESGSASLKSISSTINKAIKNIDGIKGKFDSLYSSFNNQITSGSSTGHSISSEVVFDTVDEATKCVDRYKTAVDQLRNSIESYEKDAENVKVSDKAMDLQKRKVNANLLSNARSEVSEYLKAVRHFMKEVKFTDIRDYNGKVSRLSVQLSDIRRQLDSKGEDGVSNNEYDSISADLNSIKSALQDIRSAVADASKVYNKETNHGLLTKTLLQMNGMWRGFASDCNPNKVAASGMSKDSVEQCKVFYDRVKGVYSRWRKEIQEKITEALSDMDKYSEDVDALCQRALTEFNASIVASKRSFNNVQEYEAGRQKQMSPSEYRQKARADFVNECRSIRDRDELTSSEMIDELVGAMNKVLPGRDAFHRQMLNVLSRDVNINANGRVDDTSMLSKNILLIGAPGNGKTEEARAATEALGLKVIYANGDNFADESKSNAFYNNLVNETVNANSRYVIFFDEIDAIFANRAIAGSDQVGAVTVFNNFISRIQNEPQLMRKFAGTISTTNLSPDALDTALTSRFPQKFYVPKFDESDARQFLRVELEPISVTANTTKEKVVNELAHIMVERGIDARRALNLIDEAYSYAKADMPVASVADDDFEDANNDVVVHPDYLMSVFNGRSIGNLNEAKKTPRTLG